MADYNPAKLFVETLGRLMILIVANISMLTSMWVISENTTAAEAAQFEQSITLITVGGFGVDVFGLAVTIILLWAMLPVLEVAPAAAADIRAMLESEAN